jgi:hypothetical protein
LKQRAIELRRLRAARLREVTLRELARRLRCSLGTAWTDRRVVSTVWTTYRLGGLADSVEEHQRLLRDVPVTLWGVQPPRMTKRLVRVLEQRRRALDPLTLQEIIR